MKRIGLYGLLAVALLVAVYLYSAGTGSVGEIERGEETASGPEVWGDVFTELSGGREITLSVDGRDIELGDVSIYMTERMEFMVPSSIVSGAFMCAVNTYDNSRIVIEQGDICLELKVGEPVLMTKDGQKPLVEGAAQKDGVIYLPMEALEKGLFYALEWDVESAELMATSTITDRKLLPEAYDYRREGRAPAVKNQGSLGTCWSFASLQALESALLPEENLDFSEDHMSIHNSFSLNQNEGGDYTMSMAYLLAWQGPVLERDDPYGDFFSPDGLTPVKHIQEIQILPEKDYQSVKEAVFYTGGVQSSFYTSLAENASESEYYNKDTNSYCYMGEEKSNHDAVIVGWDDNYPKENFNVEPEGDGAFICINSWGERFGEDGFFYISYYDVNIGIHNILYTGIEETDNYDKIYQTDLCGWAGHIGYGEETAYAANVYESGPGEQLEAVGFYATMADTEYEVYCARRVDGAESLNDRTLAAAGRFRYPGFYTVPFKEPVSLEDGERYAVIVKITTPGAVHPIAIEYGSESQKGEIDLSDGEGYISLQGDDWIRTEEKHNCNICLKAYTSYREAGQAEEE